jgi:hypothetical protein
MIYLNTRSQMLKGMEHHPPLEIRAELRAIEQEILRGTDELEGVMR